jgi:hypothetical protein
MVAEQDETRYCRPKEERMVWDIKIQLGEDAKAALASGRMAGTCTRYLSQLFQAYL